MAIPPRHLRIPVDAPVPAGWERVPFSRNTRVGQLIREKQTPGKPPVTQADIDDIVGKMSKLNLGPVEEVKGDALADLMGDLSMNNGGRKRRGTRKTRGRKRRTTRKR